MRARNIKPGFFKNDQLAEIEPLGRILFAGLWCLADREGRLEDRPKRIKAEILPYDDCDVDDFLNQLAERDFIIRYEIDGNHYIQIINFSKHQNPHKNEAGSSIPAPPDFAPEKHSTSTVQVQEKHSTNPADSLIPDSLIPEKNICAPAAHESEENTPAENSSFVEEGAQKKQEKASSGKGVEYSQEFEEFWTTYPRRKEKQTAFRCWKTRLKEGHKPRDMIEAAQKYRDECAQNGTEEKYIKLAKTFLGPSKPFLEYLESNQKVVNIGEYKPGEAAKFYDFFRRNGG